MFGWMYASKSAAGTFGNAFWAAAGMEGRVGSPVARQSPPQKGRSFAMGVWSAWDFQTGCDWGGGVEKGRERR